MYNLLISFLYLLLTFVITILCFKKYGKYCVYFWMCVSIIICNIQSLIITEFFGMTVSMGNLSYGYVFLCTDILSEFYGENSVKTTTRLSCFTMILFTIFIQIFLLYKTSINDFTQNSLLIIFNFASRITIASLIAFYFSQICDVKLYKIIKHKYNKIWISNNVSTFISQIADTLLFLIIVFYGTLQISEIINLIITMLIFKIIIAVFDIPFMLIASKFKQVGELE